jgi:DNA-binding TFAR19-related protein (PDSD5 family)
VEAELAEARGELMQATQAGDSAELQGLLVAEWRARLARLIAARPDVADELRALLLEVSRDAGSTRQQTASMTLEAQVSGGGDAYLAGRDMTITNGGAG